MYSKYSNKSLVTLIYSCSPNSYHMYIMKLICYLDYNILLLILYTLLIVNPCRMNLYLPY